MPNTPRRLSLAALVTLCSAGTMPAVATPVLVEFRSADGAALVAAGDRPGAWGAAADPEVVRKRIEARADAIAAARAAFLGSLPAELSARVSRSYRHFPLVRLDADEAARRELAANPLVAAVHEDRLRRPSMESALAYIGADAWHGAGIEGDGTAVAVLDTGIRYWNGEFGTCDEAGADGCRVKVFEGFATLTYGTGTTDPVEVANAEAHGTNVGGIVGAMAPGTDLLSLGVFGLYDADPSTGFAGGTAASDGDVVTALDWAIEHRAEYNIVSANMSLGSQPDPDVPGYCSGWMAGSYRPVFANCRDAGILPVVATGNEFVKTAVASPACIASAVRVGAGYDDPAFGLSCGTGPVVPGAVTCFSNSNALVDLIAPGNDVDAGGLFGYSGTSMAAPMVAGLAAVYQAHYASDALWTLERMRVDAVPIPEACPAQPFVHRFIRMGDHDAVLHFDVGQVLASDFDGLSIPDADPDGLELSAEVACASESCVSGAVGQVYVDLNVEHGATGELVVELEAPDGTTVRHAMAGDEELGADNVNSILGSQHLPDVFAPLRGKPIDGTWTLRVIDDTDGESGNLHRAVLLIDSARVRLDAALAVPAIVRPAEPFTVGVALVNRGNLELTAAPLVAELVAREGGEVAGSATLELPLPMAPGAVFDTEVELVGSAQGLYDVRVSTTGLAPDLAPGLVVEPQEVAITERTFAAFGVDPRVPGPGVAAQLLDWSVGLIESYDWDFGDGGSSTEADPAHAWDEEGTYDVVLTVVGPDGSSTTARRIAVVFVPEPVEPIVTAQGGGCGCRAAGGGTAAGGLGALGMALLVLRLRRRGPRRSSAVLLAAAALLLPLGCGDDDHPADGGDAIDVYGPPDVPYGPWLSLLDPGDPVAGTVDLWLRLGHERALPCAVSVDYQVSEGDWRPATLEDPAALAEAASAADGGTEHHLRWLSTADLPGDVTRVRLRVSATDGEREAIPIVTTAFAVLNFFVTAPDAVLITEVSTAERNVPGRVRDDYVELFNTTAEDVALDGWKLRVSSASGARDEFALDGLVLPAGGRKSLVEDGAEYAGGWPLPRELAWNNEGYGAVALIATYGRAVDFVRWGGSSERPPVGTTWTDDAPLPVPQTLTVLNRVEESTDGDRASDFCVARPSPDEASAGCLSHLPRGALLVTELDAQNTDDQVEVLNVSGSAVDLAGWVLLWNGDDLGSGEVPLASHELADGERLGLRDNGVGGRVVGGIMELGANLNVDGLVPIAIGLKDPYGDVLDFLAAGGSTVRWLDWNEDGPTPMPAPGTTLSRRAGDPDTDSSSDFCLTAPNLPGAPGECLAPLGITLRFSEVCPGRPDWVEIYNPGPDPVDLSQVYLSYTSPNYGGSVEDFPLHGTLEPGAVVVATDRDIADLTGEIILDGNITFSSDGDGSAALRDAHGFGIDFVMWGEPSGVPLWPDVWLGLGADKYATSETAKSIQRVSADSTDTNRREDWCWADASPAAPNNPCE
jgi:MYXO-CTERM domain-containing protein